MNKGIIFILGMGVGALAGAFLTYRKLIKETEERLNYELDEMAAYYETKIEMIKGEEETDEAQEEPPKELTRVSYENYMKKHEDHEDANTIPYNKISANPRREEEGTEDKYVPITEEQYNEENNGHEKTELYFFITDVMLVDENETILDEKKLPETFDNPDKDVLYCCDPAELFDYKIHIYDNDYYKGVLEDLLEGEDDDL